MFGFKRDTVLAVLMLFLLLPAQASAAPLVNQLADHPSPYLALHGHDPVARPALDDGTLYSPSDVLILASLRLRDPVSSRLACSAARWRLPAMEQDPYAYPTRVRILAQTSPDSCREPEIVRNE